MPRNTNAFSIATFLTHYVHDSLVNRIRVLRLLLKVVPDPDADDIFDYAIADIDIDEFHNQWAELVHQWTEDELIAEVMTGGLWDEDIPKIISALMEYYDEDFIKNYKAVALSGKYDP